MNDKKYRQIEIDRFRAGHGPFHDSAKDFIEDHKEVGAAWFKEQLEWIENGSYGAGACFVLSDTWEYVRDNKRCNKVANIGNVLLAALTGRPMSSASWWGKFPKFMQESMNQAIVEWMEQPKEFAA